MWTSFSNYFVDVHIFTVLSHTHTLNLRLTHSFTHSRSHRQHHHFVRLTLAQQLIFIDGGYDVVMRGADIWEGSVTSDALKALSKFAQKWSRGAYTPMTLYHRHGHSQRLGRFDAYASAAVLVCSPNIIIFESRICFFLVGAEFGSERNEYVYPIFHNHDQPWSSLDISVLAYSTALESWLQLEWSAQ